MMLAAIGMSVLSVLAGASVAHADIPQSYQGFTPAESQANFVQFANTIDSSRIQELPMQNRGRIKPFETFAKEENLFLTGRYSLWGLDPSQFYLALTLSNATPYVEVINIRDPDLRVRLGFQKTQRYVSLQSLENGPLKEISAPLIAKEQNDEKSLNEDEKKILEVVHQTWLLRGILSGNQFLQGLNLNVGRAGAQTTEMPSEAVIQKARMYMDALRAQDRPGAMMLAMDLSAVAKNQPMPELFREGLSKLGVEVFYNHARPFFWVGIFYVVFGILLLSGLLKKKLTRERILAVVAIPMLCHAAGFALRVYITGFAPVTNMYGTMVWMAFGVVLFGTALFLFYRNVTVYGLLLAGSGTVLLLTESIPLVLSPDMDPIVAVLRNNFWLTIHVLTISISYAAFTIAMLIGNAVLIQSILRKETPEAVTELGHLAYRAIQLGVFLLTTGIILGGWWADYSWGRFWGWDPKETWALIADLGFLAILHARYVGWLKPFGLLAAAPMSYLLVIMAWYGVNFILASGLHSYGFSSGGAAIVAVFVSVQVILFATALGLKKMRVAA